MKFGKSGVGLKYTNFSWGSVLVLTMKCQGHSKGKCGSPSGLNFSLLSCTHVSDLQKAHYSDVIIGAIASQITSLTIVYSAMYSSASQRKHQSSMSLVHVRGIHRWPVNSLHKGPVAWKMFPFDDLIMIEEKNGKTSINYTLVKCHEISWDTQGNFLGDMFRHFLCNI